MKNKIFFLVFALFSGSVLADTKQANETIGYANMYNPLTGSCFYAKVNNHQNITEVKKSDCKGDEIQAHIQETVNLNGQCNYLVALQPRLVSSEPPNTTWLKDVCYEVKKPQA